MLFHYHLKQIVDEIQYFVLYFSILIIRISKLKAVHRINFHLWFQSWTYFEVGLLYYDFVSPFWINCPEFHANFANVIPWISWVTQDYLISNGFYKIVLFTLDTCGTVSIMPTKQMTWMLSVIISHSQCKSQCEHHLSSSESWSIWSGCSIGLKYTSVACGGKCVQKHVHKNTTHKNDRHLDKCRKRSEDMMKKDVHLKFLHKMFGFNETQSIICLWLNTCLRS